MDKIIAASIMTFLLLEIIFIILSAGMGWGRMFYFFSALFLAFLGGVSLFLFYGMWMSALGYW